MKEEPAFQPVQSEVQSEPVAQTVQPESTPEPEAVSTEGTQEFETGDAFKKRKFDNLQFGSNLPKA